MSGWSRPRVARIWAIRCGRRVLAQDRLGRIAGQQADEQEQDDRQAEQDGDRPDEAADDEPQHGAMRFLRELRPSGFLANPEGLVEHRSRSGGGCAGAGLRRVELSRWLRLEPDAVEVLGRVGRADEAVDLRGVGARRASS